MKCSVNFFSLIFFVYTLATGSLIFSFSPGNFKENQEFTKKVDKKIISTYQMLSKDELTLLREPYNGPETLKSKQLLKELIILVKDSRYVSEHKLERINVVKNVYRQLRHQNNCKKYLLI